MRLTPLRKCLPKSCLVLKRAKGLFGSASSEGGTSESTTTSRTFRTAWLNPVTQNKLLAVKLGKVGPVEALDAWKAAEAQYWPQTANLSPTTPPPPPGFSQPLTPPPTNTLSLSQSLTLFPPLLLPLPISHPLIFCPPVHNLHLSSQLLPAFTVFKRTF